MAALPGTGSSLSMGTVRNYFGLSGTVTLGIGAHIFTQCNMTKHSNFRNVWWLAEPNKWGTAPWRRTMDRDEGQAHSISPSDGVNTINII